MKKPYPNFTWDLAATSSHDKEKVNFDFSSQELSSNNKNLISKKNCFAILPKQIDSISSNIDEVLSIKPSANVLSLETLTCIIRTGLPILVELTNLVNSVIIFQSQMTLLRWLTFLLRSQTVILIVLLFWIYLFLLMLVFV